MSYPIGARVLVDGRDEAIVRQHFPQGSSSFLFPHYKLDFVGGDKNVAVSVTRVGVDRKQPPDGFRRGTQDELSCPHRDVSCCDACAAAHPEIVVVASVAYWVSVPSEREALRATAARYEAKRKARTL